MDDNFKRYAPINTEFRFIQTNTVGTSVLDVYVADTEPRITRFRDTRTETGRNNVAFVFGIGNATRSFCTVINKGLVDITIRFVTLDDTLMFINHQDFIDDSITGGVVTSVLKKYLVPAEQQITIKNCPFTQLFPLGVLAESIGGGYINFNVEIDWVGDNLAPLTKISEQG